MALMALAGIRAVPGLLVWNFPIFETHLFVHWRWVLRVPPASMPDGIHRHPPIHGRVLRWAAGGSSVRARSRRYAMSSPHLWILRIASIAPAMRVGGSSGRAGDNRPQ
jgi:hypothetical protein